MGGGLLGYPANPHRRPDILQLLARNIYGKPDLTVFTGLEELSLDGLYEELPWWKSQIVQVLKNSPGLRRLELSLSADTLERYDNWKERKKFTNFFDELCEEYGETGSEPLSIQSLKLGSAVFPYEASSIEKLTNLRELEELHIQNGRVSVNGDFDPEAPAVIELYIEDEDEESGICFDIFGPAHCPNLRRLTAFEYRGDVHQRCRQIR